MNYIINCFQRSDINPLLERMFKQLKEAIEEAQHSSWLHHQQKKCLNRLNCAEGFLENVLI
jgi:hypothetical protein